MSERQETCKGCACPYYEDPSYMRQGFCTANCELAYQAGAAADAVAFAVLEMRNCACSGELPCEFCTAAIDEVQGRYSGSPLANPLRARSPVATEVGRE